MFADQDPYFVHFCRVNFDGTGFTKLTSGDGTSRAEGSSGPTVFACRQQGRADDGRAANDQAHIQRAGAQGQGRCAGKQHLGQHDHCRGPSLQADQSYRLAEYFLGHAVIEATDAEEQLRRVFGQLAREVPALVEHLNWAVGQAHLIQGARHIIWKRRTEAHVHWDRVGALGAAPDDAFLRRVSHEILSVEQACGWLHADEVLGELGGVLARFGGPAVARRLKGAYRMARAFHQYGQGKRGSVPFDVLGGMISDPRVVKNRGAWSILLRSALTR